jgi:hypothetical protein
MNLFTDLCNLYNINQSLLLLKAGVKPVIRLSGPGMLQEFIVRNKNELDVEFAVKYTDYIYGNRLKNPIVIAYFSLSKSYAEQALHAEENNDQELSGRLFGYPDCCIKSFIRNSDKGIDLNLESYINTVGSLSHYCNNTFIFDSKLDPNDSSRYGDNSVLFKKVASYYLIKHVPCAFDCKESMKIGKKTLSLLKEEMPNLSNKIIYAIKRPILYFNYYEWIVFDGTVKNNRLKYRKILPFRSLISAPMLKFMKSGNNLLIEDNCIYIYKNNILINEIPKKNKYDGVFMDFK